MAWEKQPRQRTPLPKPSLFLKPQRPARFGPKGAAVLERHLGFAQRRHVARIPEIHRVVRHSIQRFCIGRPKRFDLSAGGQQTPKIMSPSESNSCLQQTRFEVLLDALLTVKTG